MSQDKTDITQDDPNSPFEDPDEKKKGGCISPVGLFCLVGVTAVLGAIVVPNYISSQSRGGITACKSNLKNIGTGLEMYSTDWDGMYPTTFAALTPNYLKTIPECYAAGRVTYTLQTGENVAYNTAGFKDYYFLQCEGANHTSVSVPENYPQYDGVQGLIDR
jgi:type II secretory pathway pseudopilin PulG